MGTLFASLSLLQTYYRQYMRDPGAFAPIPDRTRTGTETCFIASCVRSGITKFLGEQTEPQLNGVTAEQRMQRDQYLGPLHENGANVVYSVVIGAQPMTFVNGPQRSGQTL